MRNRFSGQCHVFAEGEKAALYFAKDTGPLPGGNMVPHVRTEFCRKLLEWSVWQSEGEILV